MTPGPFDDTRFNLWEALGLQYPLVQAGMGGDVTGGELAGAVSAAGALGAVGMTDPITFAIELHRAVSAISPSTTATTGAMTHPDDMSSGADGD